jgi:ABC-type Fe3+ transport system permease subunit
VLPPLCAVVLTGAGAGFAPLREPGVVLNTLMFGALTTICALLLGGALRALDPSLLGAARVHGVMPHLVFRRIVLPLLLPAGLASAVLIFVQAIGMFSVPAVLGMPARFNVATTEIYQLLESYPPRTADATAWGMLLLAITALMMLAQSTLLGRRAFITITGKAFRPNQHPPRHAGCARSSPGATSCWRRCCRWSRCCGPRAALSSRPTWR